MPSLAATQAMVKREENVDVQLTSMNNPDQHLDRSELKGK